MLFSYQLSAYSCISLEGPKTRILPPPDPECEIWDFIGFQACFRSLKSQKNVSRGIQEPIETILKVFENDFHEKSIVAIPSMRKPRFASPRRRNFDSEIDKEITWKRALQKQNFQVLELQKLLYTDPKITPKSNKILYTTISSPSCYPHGPPGWPPGAKTAPPGAPEVLKWFPRMAKMEAPGPLNGNPRSQEGPAAEGVALKIM